MGGVTTGLMHGGEGRSVVALSVVATLTRYTSESTASRRLLSPTQFSLSLPPSLSPSPSLLPSSLLFPPFPPLPHHLSTHLLRNKLIEPACIKLVAMESVRLQQCDEVLHSRSEIPSDGQLLQSKDHIPPSNLPRLSPAEAVTKLRICKLVETARSCHAEVAPHVVAAAKI